jgi:hypothetical protein
MKLGTWKHPRTGETRIYFNGIHGIDVKVFAVKMDEDRFEIKFSGWIYPSQADAAMDTIERELEQLNGGERVLLFSELEKLAGEAA